MELPPDAVVRNIVRRIGRIRRDLADEIGQRPCVLPNGEFFPDAFTSDAESLHRLVTRMQEHAGMEDIPVRALLTASEGATEAAGGCSSGACAPVTLGGSVPRVVERDEEWLIQVAEPELRHPVALTATIARALATVFVLETSDPDEPAEVRDATVDLVAVELGFGALMMEGAYIYSKSCGGPSVASVTALSAPELAVAAAFYFARSKRWRRAALAELSTTQKALVRDALALVDSNGELLAQLQSDPRRVAGGKFELSEAKPWLARVLGKSKRSEQRVPESPEDFERLLEDMAPAAPKRARASQPEDDELRSLVDEALAESRGELRDGAE